MGNEKLEIFLKLEKKNYENIFLLMLRQNQAIEYLGLSPPFLYFKDSSFTQIQQKRPSQTPVLARF